MKKMMFLKKGEVVIDFKARAIRGECKAKDFKKQI
jgi:hypothetical protein